jgi:hypothetical protein
MTRRPELSHDELVSKILRLEQVRELHTRVMSGEVFSDKHFAETAEDAIFMHLTDLRRLIEWELTDIRLPGKRP